MCVLSQNRIINQSLLNSKYPLHKRVLKYQPRLVWIRCIKYSRQSPQVCISMSIQCLQLVAHVTTHICRLLFLHTNQAAIDYTITQMLFYPLYKRTITLYWWYLPHRSRYTYARVWIIDCMKCCRGYQPLWSALYIQPWSGRPVYQWHIHRRSQGSGYPDQHGRQGFWVGNVSNCKMSRIIMASVTYKLGRQNIGFSL